MRMVDLMKRKNRGPTLLARAVIDRGLTQESAAALCNLSQPTLSRILRGKQDPTEETIAAFEAHMGIPRDAWARRPSADLLKTAGRKARAA